MVFGQQSACAECVTDVFEPWPTTKSLPVSPAVGMDLQSSLLHVWLESQGKIRRRSGQEENEEYGSMVGVWTSQECEEVLRY